MCLLFVKILMVNAVFFVGSGGPAYLGRKLLVDIASEQLHGAVGETLHKIVAQIDGVFTANGLGGADDVGGHDMGSARQGLDDDEGQALEAAG